MLAIKNCAPFPQVLCVYSPKGDLIAKWEKWLQKDDQRSLLVFKEEASKPSLSDGDRIRFFHFSNDNQEELFKQLAWEYLFLDFSYELHPSCSATQRKKAEEHFSELQRMHMGVHLLASDFRDLGAQVIKNVTANLKHHAASREGKALFQQFNQVPAIICGAGPSLKKNLSLLKSLHSHALLLAGGSTLNILARYGLTPHFSAGIDPNPPYRRFMAHTAFEAPFFYQDRLSKDILSSVHAEKIWMPGSGGYPLEEWLISHIHSPSSPFDGGWNVSTFLTAIAVELGCSPIIFVGMDLAGDRKSFYAEGIQDTFAKEELIEVLNEKGEVVLTRKDWLMAAHWLESFASSWPDKIFINATEGGLSLKGIPSLALRHVKEQYLQKSFDFEGLVHTAFQSAAKKAGPIEKYLQQVFDSFTRCQDISLSLLKLYEEHFPHDPLEKSSFILLQFELEEELVYQKFLFPLWSIWGHLFQRQPFPHYSPKAALFLSQLLFFQEAIHKVGMS